MLVEVDAHHPGDDTLKRKSLWGDPVEEMNDSQALGSARMRVSRLAGEELIPGEGSGGSGNYAELRQSRSKCVSG